MDFDIRNPEVFSLMLKSAFKQSLLSIQNKVVPLSASYLHI